MTTYRVTGNTAFYGVKPGEEFDADLDPDQERRAIARGQLTIVDDEQEEEDTADA